MFQATTDNKEGASVTSDLSFSAGSPGKLEVKPMIQFRICKSIISDVRGGWNDSGGGCVGYVTNHPPPL